VYFQNGLLSAFRTVEELAAAPASMVRNNVQNRELPEITPVTATNMIAKEPAT